MKKVILTIIKFYKKAFSPLLIGLFGRTCRYTPTCSDYAYQAVDRFGVGKGIALAIKRIISCNYLSNKNHFDPIPVK